MKQDFDSFVNKLRKHYNQSQFITTKDKNEECLEQSVDRFEPSPEKTKEKIYNFRAKPVNSHSLENFIEMHETCIYLDLIIIKEFAITFQLRKENLCKNCVL